MRRNKIILLGITLPFLLLLGCATVKTDEEWSQFKETSRERTGHELLWEQSEGEEASIRKEIKEILADGLSRDEAVRIALLNNRLLQSTFEEIGISKSDLVQAGLFRNPSIGALFRFPLDGGITNIDAFGIFSLADFWQIPFRKRVAAVQLEMSMMRVNQIVLDTAAEAKRAYDALYYLHQGEKQTGDILKKFQEINNRVKTRRQFGFVSDLDIYLSQVLVVEAEMALYRIQKELSIEKAHLDQVLGLKRDLINYKITQSQGSHLPEIPNVEEAFQQAQAQRFDLQMARFKIMEAERKLELEKVYVLREVNVLLSYERDTDKTEVFGPGLDIQLPIFDQNQAQIAKARYMVRRARKRLQALEEQIKEEVIRDLERIDLQKTRANILEQQVIPLRRKALEYSNRWVQAMQLNRLFLLEAQKGLMQTQLDLLQTQMELHRALVDLERHLGGKLPL
jgi:cobalt-zinc-cadmium efflux system outer membrane protein